jgi:uncharacterized damage-inducible protein DinB
MGDSIAAMTPDHAVLFRGFLLPPFVQEHSTTRRVIEAIPAEKGDFRPDAVSRTTLELAWHIVSAEHRFLTAVCAGAFEFAPIPQPEDARDPAGMAAWFDRTFAASRAQVEALPGEQLARVMDFRGLFSLPAVAFVQIAMSHTIHHRGQLSVHLRTMGATVPSIYGETYELAQARLAREAKPS